MTYYTYCNHIYTVTDFVYLFYSYCSSSLKASDIQEKASPVHKPSRYVDINRQLLCYIYWSDSVTKDSIIVNKRQFLRMTYIVSLHAHTHTLMTYSYSVSTWERTSFARRCSCGRVWQRHIIIQWKASQSKPSCTATTDPCRPSPCPVPYQESRTECFEVTSDDLSR